jgi:hypothetical protein
MEEAASVLVIILECHIIDHLLIMLFQICNHIFFLNKNYIKLIMERDIPLDNKTNEL